MEQIRQMIFKENDSFNGRKVSQISDTERATIVEQFQARGVRCTFVK